MAGNIQPAAIHRGAHLGSAILVQRELGKGVSAELRDEQGNTPLHFARTTTVTTLLIANRADVNAKNDMGLTPLHLVPLKLSLREKLVGDMATILLQNGADANARDLQGNTPLQDAARFGKTKYIAQLLQYGADPNIQNNEGLTPLHAAVGLLATSPSAQARNVTLGVLGSAATLTSALTGMNYYLASRSLHLATTSGAGAVILKSVRAIVRRILGRFAWKTIKKVPRRNVDQAAEQVMSEAHTGAARYVSKKAIVAASIVVAVIALMIAANAAKRGAVVNALVDGGADVNIRDNLGNTPLHIMAAGQRFKFGERKMGPVIAHMLINAGADYSAINDAGYTPYGIARRNHRYDLLPVLSPGEKGHWQRTRQWIEEKVGLTKEAIAW